MYFETFLLRPKKQKTLVKSQTNKLLLSDRLHISCLFQFARKLGIRNLEGSEISLGRQFRLGRVCKSSNMAELPAHCTLRV